MRHFLSLILTLFAWQLLTAQVSFQKKLPVLLDSALVRCTPDGENVYIAATVVRNSQARVYVYKIDGSGNLSWVLQHVSANTALRLVDLLPVSDGLMLALTTGNGLLVSDGFLQKFDLNGQPLWGKRIGPAGRTQLTELESGGQESIFISGVNLPDAAETPGSAFYFLMRCAPDGSPITGSKSRHHYFPGSDDEIYQMTHLSWNTAAGLLTVVEDFSGPYSSSYISALNRATWSLGHTTGDLDYSEQLWGISFKSLIPTAGHIAFSGKTVFLTPNLPVIGLLDGNGKDLLASKVTPRVCRAIRSHGNDILFYDPLSGAVTRYDTLLNPVWSRKLDHCNETVAFRAEAGANGALYSVRNISGQTIVNKLVPGAPAAGCPPYPAEPPALSDPPPEGVGDNNAIAGVTFPLLSADSALAFSLEQAQWSDFCVRLDAAFTLPDTLCEGAEILPEGVDDGNGLSHTWRYDPDMLSYERLPEFRFAGAGIFRVTHTVSNPLCSDTVSRLVHVVPGPVLHLRDTVVCGPAKLTLDLSDAAATAYWLDGVSTDPLLTLTESGVYQVRAANAQCVDRDSIRLKIVAFPWPVTEPDTTLCSGEAFPVTFAAGFESVSWDGQPAPDTFWIRDGVTHTYQATYSADPDCRIRGELVVPRIACLADLLYVPNSFSPNGDGVNERFEISPTAEAEILACSVYDRWGARIFRTEQPAESWDGRYKNRLLPTGVYVYQVQYRNRLTGVVSVKAGNVTLFR